MRLREISRTSPFRLSLLYGVVFALATVALLDMIYLRSTGYLTQRVDRILAAEANAQMSVPPAALRRRIDEALPLNGGKTSVYALFAPDGQRIVGNLPVLPPGLKPSGKAVEVPPSVEVPAITRLIARKVGAGEILVVGRDINQLSEMRRIIGAALIWSGSLILPVGLALGAALSLGPLRRLHRLQAVSQEIASGALTRRMPVSHRGDELDMFAETVNHMIGQVERLMSEMKASTEIIAHDLRTPLTRARAQLHRLEQSATHDPAAVGRIIAELDEVLERFRAILRISEIEQRARNAGFSRVDLGQVLLAAAELYQPLAEDAGLALALDVRSEIVAEADPKLLFEAVSNLLDNAIKFTRSGGHVQLRLDLVEGRPRIVVEDNGPGVAADERGAVLQRFYRSDRDRLAPGSGLGLSIVQAITRLHRFDLELEDAGPGLRVVITGARAA